MLIETITAKLQADVGDFQAGLRNAEASVERFQKRTSATMFGKGGFATGQQAAREILAAMHVPEAAVGRVNAAVKNLGRSMQQTTGITRTFRTAFQALAFQAIGLPGPLGRVSSSLLMFAGGSFLTIGVLAGLAAIGAAFEALGRKAEEAEQVLRDTASRIMGHLQAIAVSENVAGLRARRDELQAAVDLARSSVARQVGGAPTAAELRDEQELEAVKKRLVALSAQEAPKLAALNQEIGTFVQELPLMQIELEGIATGFLEWAAATDQARAAMEALQRSGILEFEAGAAERIFQMTGGMEGLPMFGIPTPEEVQRQLDLINEAAGIGGDKLNATMLQLGLNAMESLARGLLQGARDVKRLLFNLLLDFALAGIFQGIGSAITKLFGVGDKTSKLVMASADSGISVTPTANLGAAPMALQFSPTNNWPPPRTPFDMARDAEIQRWLREAVLVARSDGFR